MGIRTQPLRTAILRGRFSPGDGTKLRDRFELLVKLGSGGFGTVWEGFDMLLERPVAIKQLPVDGELSDDRDALREARATARLNHPAIVSLYEILVEDGHVYMISELVHGTTLDELIDRRLLSDADSGKIGSALCEALAHAHAKQVVHRDVKPANVIVTEAWIDGTSGWRSQPAKLMDFGIASIVDSEHGRGPHAGSLGYVAPEQEDGEAATPASDLYSLALVLFECFSGAPPRRGRNGRLARLRRDLPQELTECIDRCLEPDPMLRPPIDELASELDAATPELTDYLHSTGLLARINRRRQRGSLRERRARSADQAFGGEARDLPHTSFSMRLVVGALAALATVSTAALLVDQVPAVDVGIAAATGFVLPRAGLALVTVTAATVLSFRFGQDGSAALFACLALIAALALAARRIPLICGALIGAGAFCWLLALQAASGDAILITQPHGLPQSELVRESLPAMFTAVGRQADAVHFASLGLWALIGAVGGLLLVRRARIGWWLGLTCAAAFAQIALAEQLGAGIPPVTLLVLLFGMPALGLAAIALGRLGAVFGDTPLDGQHAFRNRH